MFRKNLAHFDQSVALLLCVLQWLKPWLSQELSAFRYLQSLECLCRGVLPVWTECFSLLQVVLPPSVFASESLSLFWSYVLGNVKDNGSPRVVPACYPWASCVSVILCLESIWIKCMAGGGLGLFFVVRRLSDWMFSKLSGAWQGT